MLIMKKYLIILFIILLIGCSEDFVEKYPNTSLVVENFYKTPSDAEQALTTIYSIMLNDDWWSSFIISEIASDNCAGGGGSGDGGGYQRFDRALAAPETNVNSNPWKIYFGGIYRANVYIENEENIDWSGNEDLRNQYLAEARFLRAYFHFYLSRLFGEIPMLDRTLLPGENPERTPAEDLFSFILDDLEYSIANALSAPYGSMEAKNWGRVTKWAAEAMYTRVFLFYTGYYNDESCGEHTLTKATTNINDCISNSGHALVPNFASLWRVPTLSELGDNAFYAGEINSEVVWSVRFEATGNPFQWLSRMIGPRATDIDPYGRGWGAIPVLPTLWNLFDTADSRKTATILSWDDEGLVYSWEFKEQAQYTGFNSKKYQLVSEGNSPVASDWQKDGDEDLMMVRFADILLMGAELSLLNGDNGTALNRLNQVRERAFGDDSHNLSSISIDDILLERRFELACEGLRFWDILRSCKGDFSKLAKILTYVDDTDGGDFSQSVDVYSLDVDGNNFITTKGLFQIPQEEIDLMDGAIKQNPGFESN